MKRKVSEIIKKHKNYNLYVDNFFVPEWLDVNKIREEFIKFIISKEKYTYHYLVLLLKRIDDNFSLPSESWKDPIIYIDNELKNIELIWLTEILMYSHIRNKGISFYEINNLDYDELENKINNLFFTNKKIWEISDENLFHLNSIIDWKEWFLLIFNTRWKEIKFLNKELKYIVDEEPQYVSCYISKNNFISIAWFSNEDIRWKFLKFLANNLEFTLSEQFKLLKYIKVFETSDELERLTRKWEIEIKWKNEYNNNSSKHSKYTDLRYKDFFWTPSKTWWDFNIDWVNWNVNLWFSWSNKLALKKLTLMPEEYILTCEFFYEKILIWKYIEPDFNTLFKYKIYWRNVLIYINEKDFFEETDKILKKYKKEYWWIIFSKYWEYKCNECDTDRRILKSEWDKQEFSCENCKTQYNYLDIQKKKMKLVNHYLDFDEEYYKNLFDKNFEWNKKDNNKEAEYNFNYEWENKQIIVKYWIYNKKNIEIVNDNDIIILFLSPEFENKSKTQYEIIWWKKNKNIYLDFSLDMFETLKNEEKRNLLFKNICSNLEGIKIEKHYHWDNIKVEWWIWWDFQSKSLK